MVIAVIVAGGTGSRMGAAVPKQFLMLGDEPILIRTLRTFSAPSLCDKILLGVHPDWLQEAEALVRRYLPQLLPRLTLVPGGRDRNDTLYRCLLAAEAETPFTKEDILVTHDGVRPFVTEEQIRRTVLLAGEQGACSLAIPSVDSLFVSEDGKTVSSMADRSRLFRVQTPQTFRALEWKQLYEGLTANERAALTDATGMYLLRGRPVVMAAGSPDNLKITTPEDYALACRMVETEV